MRHVVKEYTRLKQKITKPPYGDCVRTVIACLLNKEDVEEIPNFMKDGEEKFRENLDCWMEDNGFEYIELTWQGFCEAPRVPKGLCGVVGDSPNGDYLHMVVGDWSIDYNEDGSFKRTVYLLHDVSPSNKYIIGNPKYISFLTRKFKDM